MRTFIYIVAIMVTGNTFAQTITDALRYSTSNVTGTARYRAMGGAFGALGGDLSAIGDNPASSAVFTRGTASVTFANTSYDNTSSFFGEQRNTSDSDLDVNQVGGVFVIGGTHKSRWSKIALSFNYDRTANYDDQFIAQGVNSNSISSYFEEFAQGVPLELLETVNGESISGLYQFLGETEGFGAQQAFLGFQSFILEPESNELTNTNYSANTRSAVYDQEYVLSSRGSSGKASFNIAAQYNDNLYIGINLNSHFVDYDRTTVLFESNGAGAEENLTNVTDIRFENNLSTIGSGFSFQLGAISKVNENLRLGFTYDSPTWLTISEETSQQVSTIAIDDLGEFSTNVNPQLINVFEDYEIKTPGKLTGSAAYLFGKQGLISFDYTYQDFSNLRFRPESDSFFNNQNTAIQDVLQVVHRYKLGGEIRSNEWSFRGGYRFETSPFEDEVAIGDLSGYSAGIGYNFGQIKIDIAYDFFTQDRGEQLFDVGLTDRATVDRDNSSIIATLSLGL